MNRVRRFLGVTLAMAISGAVTAGCASSAEPGAAPKPASVTEFTAMAAHGVHVDYHPLGSAADAVSRGDLIVRGVLAGVEQGISFRYADAQETRRRGGSYVTLVVEVDKVLDGKLHDNRVYVQLAVSPTVDRAQLARANPRPQIVLVLDDITTWSPQRGATVVRPAAVPDGAPLYVPYTDGMWLQGAGDTRMHGIGVHATDLPRAWGSVRTVDQFATAIERTRR